MLVERLGAALEGLSAVAEPLVGPGWREVAPFTLFFGAIFALALPFWVRGRCTGDAQMWPWEGSACRT